MPEEVLRRLGLEVRRRREERGMTRVDLAQQSGLHRNYLMSVERGDRNVSVGNLVRIADALGLTLSELLAPVVLWRVTLQTTATEAAESEGTQDADDTC